MLPNKNFRHNSQLALCLSIHKNIKAGKPSPRNSFSSLSAAQQRKSASALQQFTYTHTHSQLQSKTTLRPRRVHIIYPRSRTYSCCVRKRKNETAKKRRKKRSCRVGEGNAYSPILGGLDPSDDYTRIYIYIYLHEAYLIARRRQCVRDLALSNSLYPRSKSLSLSLSLLVGSGLPRREELLLLLRERHGSLRSFPEKTIGPL